MTKFSDAPDFNDILPKSLLECCVTFSVKLNFKWGLNGGIVTPNNARNNLTFIFWWYR